MFKNNKVNMVISLVIAVVLWMYVAGQVDPKTDKRITEVKITYLNTDTLQDNGLDFAGSSDNLVEVTIEGKRAQLNRIDAEDIKVTADLQDCEAGKNTVTLKAVTSKKAEVEKITPATITVTVEERINRSKPVKVKFTGKDKKGKEPGDVSTDPDNVNVYGAKSIVDKVKYIRATVPKSKIKSDYTTIRTKAVPVDEKGREVKDVWLSAKKIDVTASMMHTKKVELKVDTTGSVSSDLQLDKIQKPKTVEIKGRADTLENIESIEGNTVDISGVKKTTEIPITFDLPYGVELGDDSEDISIKVILKELASLNFEIKSDDIGFRGLDDDLEAVIAEAAYSVTVRGTDKQMEGFTKEDASFNVKLDNLGEGNYSVKIRPYTDKDVKSVTVSPEDANVTITKKSDKEDE